MGSAVGEQAPSACVASTRAFAGAPARLNRRGGGPAQPALNTTSTVAFGPASVPAGLDVKGLPLGLQVIGRPWDEAGMLDVAFALERASGFAAKPEKWW